MQIELVVGVCVCLDNDPKSWKSTTFGRSSNTRLDASVFLNLFVADEAHEISSPSAELDDGQQ
jgi:hypothetical protein